MKNSSVPHSKFAKFSLGVVAVAALSLAVLWSFNTISDLFDGPKAQFEHVIGVAVLWYSVRWLLLPSRGRIFDDRFESWHRSSRRESTHERQAD